MVLPESSLIAYFESIKNKRAPQTPEEWAGFWFSQARQGTPISTIKIPSRVFLEVDKLVNEALEYERQLVAGRFGF